MANQLRAPHFTPADPYPFAIENRTWLQQGNALLQGSLGQGANPFSQTDWPVPAGPPLRISNRLHEWGGNAILLGRGVAPFIQVYGNPPPGAPLPQANREWIQSLNPNLGGGGASPPIQKAGDPNPRGYEFPRENLTYIWEGNALYLGVGIPAVLPPYFFGRQDSQPAQVRGYPYPMADRSFLSWPMPPGPNVSLWSPTATAVTVWGPAAIVPTTQPAPGGPIEDT